jgi:hypothetical protein
MCTVDRPSMNATNDTHHVATMNIVHERVARRSSKLNEQSNGRHTETHESSPVAINDDSLSPIEIFSKSFCSSFILEVDVFANIIFVTRWQ